MKIKYLLLILTISPLIAHADLPLTVADILADKSRFKLDTELSYYNQQKTSAVAQGFNSVDLGGGRTIYLPNIGESNTNTDSLIASFGLRYGVSDRLEMGIKANGVYRNDRHQNGADLSKSSDTSLNDVSLATQYQVIKNHKTLPDGLLFGELSLYDNTQGLKNKSGGSALVGLSVYTVNDPIVLSLTGTYQHQTKRELQNGGRIHLGDTAMLNGTVGFAVNPDITLTGGVSVRHKWADKNDFGNIENNQTQTSLNLGLAYALSARSNLTANVRTPISGASGSTVSVGLTTKIGDIATAFITKYRQAQKQNAK